MTIQIISSFNLKMIYLVRDPRATMNSRNILKWCMDSKDCRDPQLLCEDLASNFFSAIDLLQRYPDRFKVVRYEDLAMNVDQVTKGVLEFTGLPFGKKIEDKKKNVSQIPFNWLKKLNTSEVSYKFVAIFIIYLQNICRSTTFRKSVKERWVFGAIKWL